MNDHTNGDQKRARRARPTFADALAQLQSGDETKLGTALYYGLANLSPADERTLVPVWDALSAEYRTRIMRRLVDIAETNYELDYRRLALLGLDDPDEDVRHAAVDLLFEDDTLDVMDRMIQMAQEDEAVSVRAAAASALGRYILGGELGELPEHDTARAQDAAVAIWSNDDEEIDDRRRALEAIANSSHELVPEAITDAYRSSEHQLRVSAVFAMGRTCDAEQWGRTVLRELSSPDPEVRYEAARASGELELIDAVGPLVRIAFDADREIQEVAIWSLGEIGSLDATRALNKLLASSREAGDDDLIEAIEDALASASLATGKLFDPAKLDD